VRTRFQKHFNATLVGGLFASMSCMHGIAGAATEAEPNDTQPQAQVLLIPAEGSSVSALMGTGASTTTDLDIYAFNAEAGDVPTIMVVSDGTWDPLLILYDSSGSILDMNDDAYPMNPGSVSPLDSRIDMYRINTPGTYYAVVTPIPRFLETNFVPVFPDPGAGGAYNLMAGGVTAASAPDPVPPVVVADEPVVVADEPVVVADEPEVVAEEPEVITDSSDSDPFVPTIRVKNWHGKVAQDGKKSKGKKSKGKKHGIPVAIMSAPGFDAMSMIDKSSLTFGATGDERSLMNCRKKGKGGRKDLVCYFSADATGLTENDLQGTVKGTWVDSYGHIREFVGSAALSVVIISNKKGESWHVRHGVDPRGKKYKERKRGKKTSDRKHGKHEKHSKLD
jgi:hypothetical protein